MPGSAESGRTGPSIAGTQPRNKSETSQEGARALSRHFSDLARSTSTRTEAYNPMVEVRGAHRPSPVTVTVDSLGGTRASPSRPQVKDRLWVPRFLCPIRFTSDRLGLGAVFVSL